MADPVISTHPRLLLTASERTRLLARKNANDPAWQALEARADTLATYPVAEYHPYNAAENTIYYTYQGESWLAATMPLAIAYQMTGDTKYSNKLLELAQVMIRAQDDPPEGIPPVAIDSYYASRAVAPTIAFIYDFCYDQISLPANATLKANMINLMVAYYDDFAVNGYEAQNYSNASGGNYFGGHLYGAATMGYALFGDHARAQEMIDWARIRFDGTPSALIGEDRTPMAWRTQCFEGGFKPVVAYEYNGPATLTGAPFKSGFDFQAWSYGSEEFGRMIEYMHVVKSATGEDLITPRLHWFQAMLRAEKHALFPNRFMIDPTGDWGGRQGAIISRSLPTLLGHVLAGTADGPGAQHFAYSWIAESTIPGTQVFSTPEWVDFVFGDPSRTSSELVLPPYYTAFGPNYPQGGHAPEATNGAPPYFIMRSDWSTSATWASIYMGNQWWGDHQHYNAGHMILARGGDYLLVGGADWKTEYDGEGNPTYGVSGVLGDSTQALNSSAANTLFFDDHGAYQSEEERQVGGQSYAGIDEIVANELSQDFSYVRGDLSTAYNRDSNFEETPLRQLDYFYRNFLYVRASNVFVVFDQVKAKTSAEPEGPYRKHIRWHVPANPVITGKSARIDHGQSRLFINAVLPSNATVTEVDEWFNNPDPCEVGEAGCVPNGQLRTPTFRIEIRSATNPLTINFLTVLQPGSNTSTAPTTTSITATNMSGVDITQAGSVRTIALFNNRTGQVPAPITSTSYNFSSATPVSHTLMGLVPNAAYAVTLNAGVLSVTQDAGGDKTASPSGVLHFMLPAAAVAPGTPTGVTATAVSSTQVNVSWGAVGNATSYQVDRRAAGEAVFTSNIGTPTTNAFSDTTALANNSYLYRVRALNSVGPSPNSATDLATTVIFDDDPLIAQTTLIRAVHLTKLRTAVNAVRALAGLGGGSYANSAAVGTIVRAVDVTELRTALDQARGPLGFPTGGYTNASLTGQPVRAVDIQELRTRVK